MYLGRAEALCPTRHEFFGPAALIGELEQRYRDML